MGYIVGVDLGQQQDFTAIAVVERLEPQPSRTVDPVPYTVNGKPYTPDPLDPEAEPTEAGARYHCRHLEQVPIGTSYPDVAERVRTLMAAPELRGASLVVDATGVGRPVVDMLRQQGLSPVGITITGGDAVTRDSADWRVPKRDLVGALQVLLQTGRLKFAKGLPNVKTLVKEMMAFRVKISTATAHDSYGAWREGEHDDLVLAVAVAVWWADRRHSVPFFF